MTADLLVVLLLLLDHHGRRALARRTGRPVPRSRPAGPKPL